MTNVRRPKHLQLHRPSSIANNHHHHHHHHHAMVSSASGPGPFGENVGGAGLTPMSPIAARPGSMADGRAPSSARTPVIRPTALITNFNNCAQPPSSLTLTLTGPSIQTAATRSPPPTPPTTCLPPARTPSGHHQAKALSPSGLNDSLPSLIMPHLYVGNQEQTNRETVNKLNIKYILSLGLLPMISANATNNNACLVSASARVGGTPMPSPTTHASQAPIQMPSRNSSRDFKIRIRSNTSSASPTRQPTVAPCDTLPAHCHLQLQTDLSHTLLASAPATTTAAAAAGSTNTTTTRKLRDENEGVKQVRSVYCKCINIADNSESSLSKFFDEAYAFIEEARRKKCNILIHCLAGISRSPTIAIAYLMRLRSLHWKDAYELVKQCRPQIDPNLNFMGQLRIYNRLLRDQQLTSMTIGCKRASTSALVGADDQTSAIKSSKTSCGQSSNKSLSSSPMTPPAVATTATSLGDL